MNVLGRAAACLGALPAPATLASSVHAASFDCAKASSAMERLVCGDAALGARDAIMARLYAGVLRAGDRKTVEADQRTWLVKAQACRTVACLAEAYDGRNARLQRSQGGTAAGTDFFTEERDGASNTLNVMGSVDGFASVSLTATYFGAGGAEAGDVYAAATGAFLDLCNGPAAVAQGNCKLTFTRLGADRWKVGQAGTCDLPGGTTYAGIYTRNKATPSSGRTLR